MIKRGLIFVLFILFCFSSVSLAFAEDNCTDLNGDLAIDDFSDDSFVDSNFSEIIDSSVDDSSEDKVFIF